MKVRMWNRYQVYMTQHLQTIIQARIRDKTKDYDWGLNELNNSFCDVVNEYKGRNCSHWKIRYSVNKNYKQLYENTKRNEETIETIDLPCNPLVPWL